VNYATRTNGKFFPVVRCLRVSDSNPSVAVVGSAANEQGLRFSQPYENHNEGHLVFGQKDGMLYAGTGDGRSGRDPPPRTTPRTEPRFWARYCALALSTTDLSKAGYSIPATTNPFANNITHGLPGEIWHYGLRNPWRFTFDSTTGDMHIGDAGQSRLEEVDLVRHGAKGRNFGWRRKEGTFCYTPATHCLANRTVAVSNPIVVYGRSAGSSVTGGYLSRGTAIPTLAGRDVFADFGSGAIVVATRSPYGEQVDEINPPQRQPTHL
jgi:glucose/arabinose dehydrogenase